MTGWLIALVVLTLGLGGWFVEARSRALQAYWRRSCAGRAWRRSFPGASAEEIRQFLRLLVDAFGFSRKRALVFAPTDRLLDIYKAVNPIAGWPDALELETFELSLNRHFRFELREHWHLEMTLGEIFLHARAKAA